MNNSHFKQRSGVFSCRRCGRLTRDVNGCNGGVQMCEDCEQGSMWENAAYDTDDEAKQAECYKKADECFQSAANKGGALEGFASQQAG